jgi:mRNA-degrading endonuclease RelE of RelBE toxin-antitoxin system
MEWTIIETEGFKKWCKKNGVDEETISFFKRPLQQFDKGVRIHEKQTRLVSDDVYEIWYVRMPDKKFEAGKKSGFRIVFVLDIEEKILILEGIFRRKFLNYKTETGKFQSNFETLIDDLAFQYITKRL